MSGFQPYDLIPGVALRHLFGGGGDGGAEQRRQMERAQNAATAMAQSSRDAALMKQQMAEAKRRSDEQMKKIEDLRKEDKAAADRLLKEIEANSAKERAAQKEVFDVKMEAYEAQLRAAQSANAATMEKMKKAEEDLEALQASDPAAYEKNEPVFFNRLMSNILSLKKVSTPKPRVAFVGMTNAGKSSLINALYNVKCKVSPVECTMGVTTVVTTESYEVVDVYGYNDKRPYYTKEQIDKFLELSAAVVLYTGSIQSCERAIELFKATRVKVIVVRSQADKESEEDLKEIERVESKLAGDYGAAAWVAASIKQPETLQKLLYLLDAVTGGRETAIA